MHRGLKGVVAIQKDNVPAFVQALPEGWTAQQGGALIRIRINGNNDANGNGTAYDELFLADNDVNGAQNEFIFALNFDGMQSQTYGGTTFLVHAAIGGSMNPSEFGVNGGWGGLRTTKNLVNQFAVDIDAINSSLGAQSDCGKIFSASLNFLAANNTSPASSASIPSR